MEFRIEQTEDSIRLVGKGKTVKTNRAFKMIPPLWSKAKKEGFMQELIDLSWENPKCSLEGILGVPSLTSGCFFNDGVIFLNIIPVQKIVKDEAII